MGSSVYQQAKRMSVRPSKHTNADEEDGGVINYKNGQWRKKRTWRPSDIVRTFNTVHCKIYNTVRF